MQLPCFQWTRQSSDQRRMRSLLVTKVSTLHLPSLGRGLWLPDDGLNTKLMHGESRGRRAATEKTNSEAGGLGSHTWASIKCLISSIPPFQNRFWKKVARSAWQVKQSGQRGQFRFKCQIKLEAEDKFQPTQDKNSMQNNISHNLKSNRESPNKYKHIQARDKPAGRGDN